MSRHVKIAALSFDYPNIASKPQSQSTEQFMSDFIDARIRAVLPDNPDLIVLPECGDRPTGMTTAQVNEYYRTRSGVVLEHIRELARENHCYIAYSAVRDIGDGTRRNSTVMIGRDGGTVGIYDKNYPMVNETTEHGILPGNDIAVFDCDFGRVGALICFDMNFEELRIKYREAGIDLVIFSSMFGGGMLRNFFAIDTRSYFVSSCGNRCPAEIISPLGESTACSGNYYPYTVCDINLDCCVVHLDFNREALRAAKEKYGADFGFQHISYLGRVLISCERDDMTVHDIMREFGIERFDDYFGRSRAHRENNLPK